MTKEERKLWFDFLKDYPERFQAQKIICDYIVDFYCAKAMLIIELDGNQHLLTDKAEKDDLIRDKFFSKLGYKVLRFSNHEINNNFRGVCETIDFIVQKRI